MIDVSVIGATGYVGEELIRLLSAHPRINLKYAVSKSFSGKEMADVYPNFLPSKPLPLTDLNIDLIANDSDVVFFCLPHGQALSFVPEFLGKEVRIIDLSGDFRYSNPDTYEAWYGVTHTAKQLLEHAIYGLPEYFSEKIASASLVANPGCYTTTSILALSPLLKEGLIDAGGIVIDAKSGVSGAGRKESLAFSYCETADNFKAYSAVNHRHTSEIEEQLSAISGEDITLLFTPHLLPVKRGILASIYAHIRPGTTGRMIEEAYASAYESAPFTHVLQKGRLPELKHVVGSNNCVIGYDISERTGRIVVVACIDNLIKGAAGQAIQNFNIMHGFEETLSIATPAWYL